MYYRIMILDDWIMVVATMSWWWFDGVVSLIGWIVVAKLDRDQVYSMGV